MEYTVDNGHTDLRRQRSFFDIIPLIRRLMHPSVHRREATAWSIE
jgi:hypothetical protein